MKIKKLFIFTVMLIVAAMVSCGKDPAIPTGVEFDAGGGGSDGGSSAPTGAIDGLFSVGANKTVYFSQGNLQYQAATNTWQFAANQYDVIGEANSNISSSNSGWIDLFGWGTSGYNGKNPYMTSTNYSDYGNGNNDIAGTNYDWGVYNAISNGGNTANTWRTLTKDEWVYVFNTRTTSSGIRYAKACVNSVNGVILLPDDWSTSTYSLSNTNSSGANYTANTITATQWVKLEAAGAVFLAAAGSRYGTSVDGVGSDGGYWSASYSDSGSACGVDFNDSHLYPQFYSHRYVGRSVRLVRSVILNPSSIFTIEVSANPSDGGSVYGGGNHYEGQSCTVSAMANTGYTFTNWTENGSVVSTQADYTFTVNTNRTLVANFTNSGGSNAPTGAINGLFSVSATQQVYFSQGNLQYQATTSTWRFAANQYDYVGNANSNISSSYSGWIDLFGWGTSGYNNKYPYMTSTISTDYGNGNNDIAGTNYDWGVNNKISNGGNQAGQWRTLTKDEWVYVFNTRTTSSGIRYAKACVNSVNGVILLPDDWSTSTYSLSNTNSSGANYTANTITATQWVKLEAAGAVFLAAAGYRDGTSVGNVGSYGDYWSASCYSSSYAHGVHFDDSGLSPRGDYYRLSGLSVRLVRSAQ